MITTEQETQLSARTHVSATSSLVHVRVSCATDETFSAPLMSTTDGHFAPILQVQRDADLPQEANWIYSPAYFHQWLTFAPIASLIHLDFIVHGSASAVFRGYSASALKRFNVLHRFSLQS